MLLNKLIVDSYRNIENIELDFEKKNLIYGENGSGKTNILDAIYQLGYGKSFHLNQNKYLIKHDKDKFTIFADVNNKDAFNKLAISKNRKGNKIAKIDGVKVTHQSQISLNLPVVCITPDSISNLIGSFSEKRSFINLCMFHVEPTFNQLWKKYNALLKQRNKAVKTKVFEALSIWDKQISDIAKELDEKINNLITRLQTNINKYAKTLLSIDDIEIKYSQGWDDNLSLFDALKDCLPNDIKFGYTTKGIHRYQIDYLQTGISVKNIYSRAQCKLLSYCMFLSLVDLLQDKNVLLLIDDPFAELDLANCGKLFSLLEQLNVQEIITTSVLTEELKNKFKLFHVEHGLLLSES